jgi:hypothetical protein
MISNIPSNVIGLQKHQIGWVGRFFSRVALSGSNWWNRSQKVVCILLVLGVWGFGLAEGFLGLDFGKHWDEINHLVAVKYSIENKILLPNFYDYPSIPYWLNLTGVIPDAIKAWNMGLRNGDEIQSFLLVALFSNQHLLFVRGVFLVLSSLGIFWVFLATRVSGTGWGSSAVAALAYGLSWEVAYHSRWIAPDAVLAQFAALLLWALLVAIKFKNCNWIRFGAIAAGLATGTKYPGGLTFLPVLVVAFWLGRGEKGFQMGIRRTLEVGGIFLLTYLLTTPGTLLQPLSFFSDVTRDIRHYASGHQNYSTIPGYVAMGQVVFYLFTNAFSHSVPFAALLFILAIIGVGASLRQDTKQASFIWIFPAVYFMYFTSQRVLIIRNYLILLPFLSLALAWGARWVVQKIHFSLWRVLILGLIVSALVWNVGWLTFAAQSIRERGTTEFFREAVLYIDTHKNQKIWVSTMVLNDIAGLGPAHGFSNTVSAPDDADLWMFYMNEDPNRKLWPANNPYLVEDIMGTWEVNFNYYPSWPGDDRIVVMKRETAKQIGVPGIP